METGMEQRGKGTDGELRHRTQGDRETDGEMGEKGVTEGQRK